MLETKFVRYRSTARTHTIQLLHFVTTFVRRQTHTSPQGSFWSDVCVLEQISRYPRLYQLMRMVFHVMFLTFGSWHPNVILIISAATELSNGRLSSYQREHQQEEDLYATDRGASGHLHDNARGTKRKGCISTVRRVMFCETQHVFTTYPVYLSCIQHSSRLFLIEQGNWVMNGYDKILGEKTNQPTKQT